MNITVTRLKKIFIKAKTLCLTKKVWTSVAVVAIVIAACSVWALHSVSVRRSAEQERQASIAKAKSLKDEQAAELAKKQTTGNSDNKTTVTQQQNTDTNQKPTTNSSSQPIKYSTSPDPRSTAYSTTPPAPSAADVNIKITHAGQVAPGTLITYNSIKSARIYYGGDLGLSPSTVTFSKSSPQNQNITISSPDGHVMGMPSLPWDDSSHDFFIAMDTSVAKSSGTSFDMFVSAINLSALPVGTYQLHVRSGWSQGDDGWQCDGFIPIKVVN